MLCRDGTPRDGATVCASNDRICTASPSSTSTAPSGPGSKRGLEGLDSASPATGALKVRLLDIRLPAASGWLEETGSWSEQPPRVKAQVSRKEETSLMGFSSMESGNVMVMVG